MRVVSKQRVRRPAARGFYPGDCRAQLVAFIADYHPPGNLPPSLHGAALPHGGWRYSGQVAARTLACFPTSTEPDTVVIFGAMHTGADIHSLYPGGEWETPLGNLAVDEVAGAAILAEAGGLLQGNARAHRQEHSIEVLAPMIKYFFPNAAIVPILVLPEDTAPYLGQVACRAMARLKRTTVFLASSDLTHYGPEYGYLPAGVGTRAEAWMRQNDQRLIDTLCRGTAEGVLSEARARFNACGAGALSALKAAMAATGSVEGHLIQYTTSFNVEQQQIFRRAVGYAGVVF